MEKEEQSELQTWVSHLINGLKYDCSLDSAKNIMTCYMISNGGEQCDGMWFAAKQSVSIFTIQEINVVEN